jgi:hypothetical protein
VRGWLRAIQTRYPGGARWALIAYEALIVILALGAVWLVMLPDETEGVHEASVAIWAVLALALPAAAREGDEALAARVNGVAIPLARFERYFEEWLAETGKNAGAIRHPAIYKRFRREALAELLDEELLRQEARKARVAVPRKQLEEALARARAQFPSRDAYLRKLQRSGFTEAAYAEHLKQQLSIQLWIEREFGTGQDAAARLQERIRSLRSAASIEVLAAF